MNISTGGILTNPGFSGGPRSNAAPRAGYKAAARRRTISRTVSNREAQKIGKKYPGLSDRLCIRNYVSVFLQPAWAFSASSKVHFVQRTNRGGEMGVWVFSLPRGDCDAMAQIRISNIDLVRAVLACAHQSCQSKAKVLWMDWRSCHHNDSALGRQPWYDDALWRRLCSASARHPCQRGENRGRRCNNRCKRLAT